jgi:hypothetical protein
MSETTSFAELLKNALPAASALIFTVVAVSAISVFLKRLLQLVRIPISHKIAVIGLPSVGKTTLITAMFEVIQRGDVVPNARLHGLKTIATINRYISKLAAGGAIGPTHEKDIFVFRFSYQKNIAPWLPRTFDVEIADFPGEYSEEISGGTHGLRGASGRYIKKQIEEYQDVPSEEGLDFTLFHREFFSWIASSSTYVFVIDLSAIYGGQNPEERIAEISARIRTSWQVIEDSASERGIGSARSRKVHVVFTKLDSLISLDQTDAGPPSLHLLNVGPRLTTEEPDNLSDLRENILKAGKHIDHEWQRSAVDGFTQAIRAQNDLNFDDLISFFKTRVHRTEVFYVSMAIRDERRVRYGVTAVVNSTLP